MFDLQKFVEDCRDLLTDAKPTEGIKELIREAISDPDGVKNAFENAEALERQGPITFAFRDFELSIADVTTPSGLRSPAHNHKMWAVIGVYEGQEHNRFFQYEGDRLIEEGERLLKHGDIAVLHPEAIHAIYNPLPTSSSAIHVYGGDLVNRPDRSMWNPQTIDREDYEITQLIKYVNEMSSPI